MKSNDLIEELQEMRKKNPELDKAFRLQRMLFATWAFLSSLPTDVVFCPVHKKLEKIKLECGLDLVQALDIVVRELETNQHRIHELCEKTKV